MTAETWCSPSNDSPKPLSWIFPPACTAGSPCIVPSASSAPPASRSIVLCARSFASPAFATTRSAISSSELPKLLVAVLRACVPVAESARGLLAVALTCCFAFGSQPVTLTELGCWVADMRGLNDRTFLRHSATGVAPPLAVPSVRRNALPSATPNSRFASAASRLRKSRSDSMLCWTNSCVAVVVSTVPACSPFSCTSFVTMSEADIFWKVRFLRPRCSRCDLSSARNESIAALLVNSGS